MNRYRVAITKLVAEITGTRMLCRFQDKKLQVVTEALAHAQAHRAAIEEAAVNAIFTVGEHCQVTSWNRSAEKMFGYAEEEVLNKSVSVIIPSKYFGGHNGKMEEVGKNGQRHTSEQPIEVQGLTKTGNKIPIELSLSTWSNGNEKFYTGIARDISWRKHAEEQSASYVEQLKKSFLSTVEVVTIISEMRDPYTVGHEQRVADIATAIGAEMGFSVQRQEGLHVAGHLHDAGKIRVPAEFLSKPGELSDNEFACIKEHSQSGYDILKGIESAWPVALVALQHHERVDGSGYPYGLKGDEISLEARIVSVADVIEAMSSHRPYRPALGIEAALEEIEKGAGKRYDGEIVAVCSHLFRNKGFVIPTVESRRGRRGAPRVANSTS